MRVIITGGGTGGHVYPALAIARGLKEARPGVELLYIGTARGLEADVVPRAGLTLATITVQGLVRRQVWKNIPALVKTGRGLGEAWQQVRRFRPDVVVGTGGYVSGPVCLAAALQGVPVILHEQNAFPGVTNRLLAILARCVCLTFPEAASRFPRRAKLVTTGLPVRPEIIQADRDSCRQHFGLRPEQLFLVTVGGSQGARSINGAMLPILKELAGCQDVSLLQVTGRRDYEAYLQQVHTQGIDLAKYGNITIEPYVYNLEQALAAADLVIGRAGASFLAEVLARGLPSVLVPYPHAAANHQEYNARAVARQGAAVVVLDRELKGGRLYQVVFELLRSREKLKAMAAAAASLGRPGALEAIIQVILKTVESG
ncbi:UDP-N-acetylglucosamine transferase [Moorella thermoacetica]|uniref:UDP-N-acetylglucosamine--N-acetylmuramyl-(pentapeptide) pyrophosphoryl-undecaprenol N-acetylglucosamine transferase n=1 Tax=Neomoorella thermoacetica TaxID=1525 RepID=A0AAC9MUF9_NEOTH|nr:undecaprenyldiphospho-muramoylpentapeptide beta-N-acetylglucosaminyltransferase [Moorella thermoacetica]AOQ23507.1 UDP-N-acetylglucosamine--N-acetylmuramyl-(pentapeptide) pyrophosphoryl-undecaprenol N-acetylglucosamine transferase [Moorella thermoacetica]TYL13692.1 UDP-N-acetylglucosamine transferase [Moorella thermoacetica]